MCETVHAIRYTFTYFTVENLASYTKGRVEKLVRYWIQFS